MEKLIAALEAQIKALNETITAKFSSANPKETDAEKTALAEKVGKLETEIQEIKKLKAVEKMVWATKDLKVGEGERAITFSRFLRGLAYGERDIIEAAAKAANGQSETSADGGYGVPVEYSQRLIELGLIYGVIRPIATDFPMASATRLVPKGLAEPTVTWTDEAATGTKTKATLAQITQTAKKLMAIVPFTTELLEDNNISMDTYVFSRVAKAFAREEDKQALVGTGSPFTGVIGATGINTATMGGAALDWGDVLNSEFAVNGSYRQRGRFAVSSDALKLIRKMHDDENRPIWSPGLAGDPGTIDGRPYVETDVILSNYGSGAQTYILFGDFENVWFSDRGQYTVDSSNSASDSSGKSAFEQDEIWFKFRKRMSIDVVLGAAFSKMLVNG